MVLHRSPVPCPGELVLGFREQQQKGRIETNVVLESRKYSKQNSLRLINYFTLKLSHILNSNQTDD